MIFSNKKPGRCCKTSGWTLQWRARGGEAERSKLITVAIFITSPDNIDIDIDIVAIYVPSLDNIDIDMDIVIVAIYNIFR